MLPLELGHINIIYSGLYYLCLLLIALILIILFYYISLIKLNNTESFFKIIEKIMYFMQVIFSGSFFLYCVVMGYNFEKWYYPLTYIYLRRETSLMYVEFSYRALKSKEKPISECAKIAPIQLNTTKKLSPVTLEENRLKHFF
jgi:hypothetical protein